MTLRHQNTRRIYHNYVLTPKPSSATGQGLLLLDLDDLYTPMTATRELEIIEASEAERTMLTTASYNIRDAIEIP